jgi:hypothetical protein
MGEIPLQVQAVCQAARAEMRGAQEDLARTKAELRDARYTTLDSSTSSRI